MLLQLCACGRDENSKELVIAIPVKNPYLDLAVAEYNRKNTDCIIEIDSLTDAESYDDYYARISAQLITGSGPDIVSNSCMDFDEAAKKGYLLNLSKNNVMGIERIRKNVLESGIYDNMVYGIPYLFDIDTLVVNGLMIDKRETWNIQETMFDVKNCGVKIAFRSMSGAAMFYMLGVHSATNNNVINWDEKKCNFISDECVEILEFCKKYESKDNSSYSDIISGNILGEGCVLISGASQAAFYESIFNGNEYYIGYPTEDDSIGSYVTPYMLSINASCKNQDIAIDFLQFLISEEMQNQLIDKLYKSGDAYGFPVLEKSLEQYFEKLKNISLEYEHKEEGYFDVRYYDGYKSIDVRELTLDGVEKLKNLVYSSSCAKGVDSIIYSIIDEELATYFENNTSAHEALSKIQNRVQLYLDENS